MSDFVSDFIAVQDERNLRLYDTALDMGVQALLELVIPLPHC